MFPAVVVAHLTLIANWLRICLKVENMMIIKVGDPEQR